MSSRSPPQLVEGSGADGGDVYPAMDELLECPGFFEMKQGATHLGRGSGSAYGLPSSYVERDPCLAPALG